MGLSAKFTAAFSRRNTRHPFAMILNEIPSNQLLKEMMFNNFRQSKTEIARETERYVPTRKIKANK